MFGVLTSVSRDVSLGPSNYGKLRDSLTVKGNVIGYSSHYSSKAVQHRCGKVTYDTPGGSHVIVVHEPRADESVLLHPDLLYDLWS